VADQGTIEVVPLSSAIGAEIRGIDLRKPLDDGLRVAIHDALIRYLVVFFRGQALSEAEQLAFASSFGRPHTATPDPGEVGGVFAFFEDTAKSPPNTDHWHTDVSFSARPPNFAVLQMVVAPPLGGDTMWASLYGAYEALSPAMRRAIAGLEAEHGLGPAAPYMRRVRGEDYYQHVLEVFRPARHPLVRVHPDTGHRALYLAGAFMNGIAGFHDDESKWLLTFLQARLNDPNLQCRWRWRQHDLAMWDERCTNHRGLSDHYPNHRLVRRCLVGDDAPIGPTDAGIGRRGG
jgi:taurine dioxygenase